MWWLRSISLMAVVASLTSPGPSPAAPLDRARLEVYADFRARLEADWDSRRSDGTEREDRNRMRVRVRLGLEYDASDRLRFGLRLRSGSHSSHQSPHITVVDFDGNDTGDAHFDLDKWYAEAKLGKGWAWIGRNRLPFWKQNELFWDDDVTPAGLALGMKSGALALNAGYFSLPVGMRRFAGNLAVAQAVYSTERFTLAAGLLDIDADPGDGDAALLLRGNGFRDYSILVASLQAKVGKTTLGIDLLSNTEDDSPGASDQTAGIVASLGYGRVEGKGDWQAAWTYARIEAFAVAASWAQDDWVRWGSATETRASDFEGHELRLVHGLGQGRSLVFRLYLVESLTSVEDGKRFRIDYNYKF